MKKITVIALFTTILAATNAQAVHEEMSGGSEKSETVVQTYSPTDGQINYSDKGLSDYQDPYLTNPRSYKSNQYGEAAPAPKPNVISTEEEPTFHEDDPLKLKAKTGSYIGKKRSN